jgi:hypothetical protein
MLTVKIAGIEECQVSTDGYGIAPWTIYMYLNFDVEGVREFARLDYVLRHHLGCMTENVREAIRKSAPVEVSVFPRKYRDTNYDQQTLYSVRKADLVAWAKRAKALLVAPTGDVPEKNVAKQLA